MSANILVIDDDEATLSALERILGKAGYGVLAAADGRKAIELLRTTPVDLIVTDMVMPERDGIEVMLHLRAKRASIPVIAVSGYGSNSPGNYLKIAKTFGAAATIEKPFTADQVLAAVTKVLGSNPPLPPKAAGTQPAPE